MNGQGERFTCKRCIDLLREFLDGELPAPVRDELARHLAGCPQCVSFVNTYRAAASCTKRRLADDEVPAELTRAIEEFFRGKVPGF